MNKDTTDTKNKDELLAEELGQVLTPSGEIDLRDKDFNLMIFDFYAQGVDWDQAVELAVELEYHLM